MSDVNSDCGQPNPGELRTSLDEARLMQHRLEQLLNSKGFEVHPFLIGWYNNVVDPVFRLPYQDDTLAFLAISIPSMFEVTFLPYLAENSEDDPRDPIDRCMMYCFQQVQKDIKVNCDIIHDFELHPNRRPKFLAQTAAHVSGAAYLYHQRDHVPNPWPDKKLMGLCLHPKYGGWFAIRGCLVMHEMVCPGLTQSLPKDVLPSPADQKMAIELFNFNWRDSRFRSLFPVISKYSPEQQLYFDTPPARRSVLIQFLRAREKCKDDKKQCIRY